MARYCAFLFSPMNRHASPCTDVYHLSLEVIQLEPSSHLSPPSVAVAMSSMEMLEKALTTVQMAILAQARMHERGLSLVWFPDPPSGGEREGSGELPAAYADLWHFNLMNLAFRT